MSSAIPFLLFDPAIFDPEIFDGGNPVPDQYPKIGKGACDPLDLFVDIGHTQWRRPAP